jgi:hypothetical protein
MAGSDLNVAFTSTTGGTQTLFSGPTRLKAFIITPTGSAGTVVFKDGGTSKFTVSTSASAASGPVNINLPSDGVRFGTSLQATLTDVGGVTAFFA